MDYQMKLSQLVGDVGTIWYRDDIGLCCGTEPLEQLWLTEVVSDGANFQGRLSCGESPLGYYPFLQNLPVQGTVTADGYSLTGAVSGVPLPASLAVRCQDWHFVLSAKQQTDGSTRIARAELVGSAVVGSSQGLQGTVTWELMKENPWTMLHVHFLDPTGAPGILVPQCLECFADLFGISADFVSFLPPGIPFETQARIYGFSFAYEGSQVYQAAVEFGFAEAGNQLLQSTSVASLEELRFFMGLEMTSRNTLFGNLYVHFRLFGQKVELLVEYPSYRIEVQIPFDLSLAQAANCLGLTLPDCMKEVRLNSLYLDATLDLSQCSMMLRLNDLIRLSLPNTASFRIEETDFILKRDSGEFQAGLRGMLSLYQEEERITAFLMEAQFSEKCITLSCGLIKSADFFQVFEALTGIQLNPGFTIALSTLEVEATYWDSFSLTSYRAAGMLSVSDTGLFGVPFSLTVGVTGSQTNSIFSGQLVLGERFAVEASATVTETKTDWTFLLVLKNLRVSLEYDNAKKQVSGIIESDFLLEDCVTWFLSLFNPEDSYAPSGEWSFLKGINLKGLTVAYCYTTNEITIGWTPSFSVPFCSFDRISIVVGAQGVRFKAQGEFLGTTYSEQNPLSWDPNAPPDTSGKLLQVQYLLLSDGLSVTGLNPEDLQKAIAQLEETITPDTEPNQLTLSANGGLLAALDCKIADAVECKLLYNESASLYGGYFRLYGEKVAGFDGLSAELSYGKVNDTTGLFHARFTPPDHKEFQLGTLNLTLGHIEAKIYTNGNFYIDVGFPKNHNFSTSFALRYGIFTGRGGLYLTQGAYGASNLLPAVQNGYFDHVIGVGLGLRLELGRSFRAGILSASAQLVLQGILEGIYAVYEPQNTAKPATPFYRLYAWASLDGTLTGRVDFGIIGASVDLRVQAQVELLMQACEQVQVSVELTIRASAQIKILFVKIRFGFSLRYSAEFTFAEATPAPWKNNRTLLADNGARPVRDPIPERLVLPLCRSGEKKRISLKVVPVFGGTPGFYTATLFLYADLPQFKELVELLMQTLTLNHYLNQTGSMELFERRRLFREPDFLERLLEQQVVLELSFPDNWQETEQSGAFLPLPQYLITSLVSVYNNGVEDYLTTWFDQESMIDDDYIAKNDLYYQSTTENKTVESPRSPGAQRSLQAQLWLDYWELLVKAVRAQKESAALTCSNFAVKDVKTNQLEELVGIANTFLLSGKRALSNPNAPSKEQRLESVWYLSGACQQLNWTDDIHQYRYELRKTAQAPQWLTFAQEAKQLTCWMDKGQIQPLLPAQTLPDHTCVMALLSPSWEIRQEDSTLHTPFIRLDTGSYSRIREGFVEGCAYQREDGGYAYFVLMVKLQLLRVTGDPALYRVTGFQDFSRLEDYYSLKNPPQATALSLLYEGDGGWQRWEQSTCYVAKGNGMTQGQAFAQAQDPQTFLNILYDGFEEETTVFLGFPHQDCCLPVGRELEVVLAVDLDTQGVWHSCINGLWCPTPQETVRITPDRMVSHPIVPQGSIRATITVDSSNLSGSEENLAGVLAGVAAELRDETGAVLSHETQPFFGQAEQWQIHHYALEMPYAKAYPEGNEDSEPNCYAWISQKRPLNLSVFFLDYTGRRVSNPITLSFVPQYQDELISPAAWTGARLSYEMRDGKWLLVYQGDGTDQAGLTEAIHQLEQPDVTVRLSGTILEVETDRKEEMLAFLKECAADSKNHHCKEVEVPLRRFDAPDFTPVCCNIRLERSFDLVDPQAPEQVRTISFQIPFLHQDSIQRNVKLRRKSQEQNGVLFVGETAAFLLTDQDCWQAKSSYYFAFRPLPMVSGVFSQEDSTVTLQSFSVKSAVDALLEDLAWIRLPEQINYLYADDPEGTMLERQYQVCKLVAQALATLVRPLFQNTPEGATTAAQSYAAQLLAEGRLTQWKDTLFYVQPGQSTLQTQEPWILEGIGMDSSYPMWLPLHKKDAMLCGAVETGDSLVNFQGSTFTAHGAYRQNRGEWYHREGTEAVFPLYGMDYLKKPSNEWVSAPCLLGKESNSQDELLLYLEVFPRVGDILSIGEKQPTACGNSSDVIPVFFHYLAQSAKLRKEGTSESRMQLLDYMEQFVKALAAYSPDDPVQLDGIFLAFEDGYRKIVQTDPAQGQIMELCYQAEDGSFQPFTHPTTYEFVPPPSAVVPEDRPLRLRIHLHGATEQFQWAVMHRPQNLETNLTSPLSLDFTLQSETIQL